MRRVPVAVSALTVIAGNAFFGKVGAKAKECRKRRADLIRTTFTWDEYHIAVFPSYKTVAGGQSDAAGRYRLKEQANNEASYYTFVRPQKVATERAIYICRKVTSRWYDMPGSPR